MPSEVEILTYSREFFRCPTVSFPQTFIVDKVVVVVSENFGDAPLGEAATFWEVCATEMSDSNPCVVAIDRFSHGSLLIEIILVVKYIAIF